MMRKSDYFDSNGVLIDEKAWHKLVETTCYAQAVDAENYVRETYFGEDPRLVSEVAEEIYNSYADNWQNVEEDWLAFFDDKADNYEFTRSEFEGWADEQIDPEYTDNLFAERKEQFLKDFPENEMKAYIIGRAEKLMPLNERQEDFVFGRVKSDIVQNEQHIISDAVFDLDNGHIKYYPEIDEDELRKLGSIDYELELLYQDEYCEPTDDVFEDVLWYQFREEIARDIKDGESLGATSSSRDFKYGLYWEVKAKDTETGNPIPFKELPEAVRYFIADDIVNDNDGRTITPEEVIDSGISTEGRKNDELKDFIEAVVSEYCEDRDFDDDELDAIYSQVVDTLEHRVIPEAVHEMERHKELANEKQERSKSKRM